MISGSGGGGGGGGGGWRQQTADAAERAAQRSDCSQIKSVSVFLVHMLDDCRGQIEARILFSHFSFVFEVCVHVDLRDLT